MTIEAIWSVSFATANERGSGGTATLSGGRVRGTMPGYSFEGEFELESTGFLHVDVIVSTSPSGAHRLCRLVLTGRYDDHRVELSGLFMPKAIRAATVLLHDRKEIIEPAALPLAGSASRYRRWGGSALRP